MLLCQLIADMLASLNSRLFGLTTASDFIGRLNHKVLIADPCPLGLLKLFGALRRGTLLHLFLISGVESFVPSCNDPILTFPDIAPTVKVTVGLPFRLFVCGAVPS